MLKTKRELEDNIKKDLNTIYECGGLLHTRLVKLVLL
jgi:hypothetical protein